MRMPSIGKDLAAIRSHKGLSVQDIQKATKIPLETLLSIEDGTIFSNQKEINTYVRSFVRTYGRAIKLNEELVTRALDQEELGNYKDLLLEDFPDLKKEVEEEKNDLFSPSSQEKTGESSKKKEKKGAPTWKFEAEKLEESDEVQKTEDEKEISSPKPISDKRPPTTGSDSGADVRNIDWAGMGKDFKQRRTQPPVWIISAGMIVLLIVVAAVVITQFELFSSDELPVQDSEVTEQPATESGQGLSLDITDEQPAEQSPAATLDDTLYITLYAAYNRLDPVRVWSDLKPRIDPYWIDEGTALNFEFQDSIRIAGSYSNMLLFLNGNRIDNFRNQYFNEERNAVELTRDLFDSDPRWATPVPLELPGDVAEPDTIRIRPSF